LLLKVFAKRRFRTYAPVGPIFMHHKSVVAKILIDTQQTITARHGFARAYDPGCTRGDPRLYVGVIPCVSDGLPAALSTFGKTNRYAIHVGTRDLKR